jgi:hypothetical protein
MVVPVYFDIAYTTPSGQSMFSPHRIVCFYHFHANITHPKIHHIVLFFVSLASKIFID